jgi:hypothetical protein
MILLSYSDFGIEGDETQIRRRLAVPFERQPEIIANTQIRDHRIWNTLSV